jgi:hypothetical protein
MPMMPNCIPDFNLEIKKWRDNLNSEESRNVGQIKLEICKTSQISSFG